MSWNSSTRMCVEERLEAGARVEVASQQVPELHQQVELVDDAVLLLHALVERGHHLAHPRDPYAHPLVERIEKRCAASSRRRL